MPWCYNYDEEYVLSLQQSRNVCLGWRWDGIVASLESWQQLTEVINGWLYWRQIFKNMKDSTMMVDDPVLVQLLTSKPTTD